MEFTKLIRQNKDLKQENKMLKRIILNLKRKLRQSRVTHRHYQRWTEEQKKKVLQLRDKEKKNFSSISRILDLTNRQCRNLYGTSKLMQKKNGGIFITEAVDNKFNLRRDIVDLSSGKIFEIETNKKRAERFKNSPDVIVIKLWERGK